MKKFILAIFILTIFSSFLFSQTPTKTPKPLDDDVVVINTNLIQIDVTVTDKNGNIVKDLKQEDFEVFENKEKQDISNFLFIQNDIKKTVPQIPESKINGNINIPIPPTKIRPESVK